MKNDSTSSIGDLSALSPWAPELAEAFVHLSSDIVLIVRPDGLIERVVQSGSNPVSAGASAWVGRPWVDTVTGDTRQKIENLLKEVTNTGVGRRREVNHPSSPGDVMNSIPVAYTAIRLGAGGPLLAAGRDLRAVAAIQQRFFDVQRETEKIYWQARQADSRYQVLFQVASDALLLIDAHSFSVLEANRSAAQLFELPVEDLTGRPATFGFDRHSIALLEELMIEARETGKQAEVRARLSGKLVITSVAFTPFRVQNQMRLLMRVRVENKPQAQPNDEPIENGEAVVLTDSNGKIVTANRSFFNLLQTGPEEQLRGHSLVDWLGPHIDTLIASVRKEGLVRQSDVTVVTSVGRVFKAQLAAVLLTDDDQERIGFTVYPAPHPAPAEGEQETLSAPELMKEWLGTGPLPSLLERASALAERLLIASAIERSKGDLEVAANLLGITAAELSERRKKALPVDPR